MIPSIFMVLEKLPLNANGKIDRKRLPPPIFPHLSSTSLINQGELLLPTNGIEVTIHHIWCDIFQQNQISIDTNIFTIGGHSLLLMQLLHRYKSQFPLQTNTLSIADLFQHSTIIGHAQLIRQTLDKTQNIDNLTWSSLNLIQGKKRFSMILMNHFRSFRCSSSIICSRTNLFR
jgi:aryl carrier-like protein